VGFWSFFVQIYNIVSLSPLKSTFSIPLVLGFGSSAGLASSYEGFSY